VKLKVPWGSRERGMLGLKVVGVLIPKWRYGFWIKKRKKSEKNPHTVGFPRGKGRWPTVNAGDRGNSRRGNSGYWGLEMGN